jgi:hypothetical protein
MYTCTRVGRGRTFSRTRPPPNPPTQTRTKHAHLLIYPPRIYPRPPTPTPTRTNNRLAPLRMRIKTRRTRSSVHPRRARVPVPPSSHVRVRVGRGRTSLAPSVPDDPALLDFVFAWTGAAERGGGSVGCRMVVMRVRGLGVEGSFDVTEDLEVAVGWAGRGEFEYGDRRGRGGRWD